MAYLLYRTAQSIMPENTRLAMTAFTLWLVFTKSVKLLPHFYRYPGDNKFIPLGIAFNYFYGLIKVYSLMTLHHVSLLGLIFDTVNNNYLTRLHGGGAQHLVKRAGHYWITLVSNP